MSTESINNEKNNVEIDIAGDFAKEAARENKMGKCQEQQDSQKG